MIIYIYIYVLLVINCRGTAPVAQRRGAAPLPPLLTNYYCMYACVYIITLEHGLTMCLDMGFETPNLKS